MPKDPRDELADRAVSLYEAWEKGGKEGLLSKLKELEKKKPVELPWLNKLKPATESPEE